MVLSMFGCVDAAFIIPKSPWGVCGTNTPAYPCKLLYPVCIRDMHTLQTDIKYGRLLKVIATLENFAVTGCNPQSSVLAVSCSLLKTCL
jgi:hypothetical protein